MANGRPIFNVERCKGCTLCIGSCPKDILVMSKDINGQGVHYPICTDESLCIACLSCATICPDTAIEIERS